MSITIRGYTIGGRIQRHLAAISIRIPLASYHRPGACLWSWSAEFSRYRRSSGCAHSFFRIVRLGQAQKRTIVDLFWIGSFQMMRQPAAGIERQVDLLKKKCVP